ncbi:MAG TPA: hypothetical protein DEB39_02910 [Planctomycetaceae bacterium]|nr:hypothetical protein [Planctomycetaceae bacterium]
MFIIATDEAGYGPNYGPLVVTATAWQFDSETPEDIFPALAADLKKDGVLIDDSKNVYHAGSLGPLENVVLGVLDSFDKRCPNAYFARANLFSSRDRISGCAVPCLDSARKLVIQEISKNFASVLAKHGARFVSAKSRSVFPAEFNELLERYDSKGTLLSNETLGLIGLMLPLLEGEPALILCDKHGGRNRYLDLLTTFLPEEFIQVVTESREKSVYRVNERKMEFRFLAKGDRLLPVALSSMISKYGRELAMLRFNEFWQSHIPNLKPTAGYPEDARRFQKDIAAKQQELGIENKTIWREK